MHTRSPRLVRLALLALPLSAAACAAHPAPAAPTATAAAEAPPAATAAPMLEREQGAPDSVEGELAALAASERQLSLLLPGKDDRDRSVRKEEGKDTKPKAAELPMSGADAANACSTACKALASMRRSADHLCVLAGDGDARCTDARSRVQSATDRVRSSCPSCAVK